MTDNVYDFDRFSHITVGWKKLVPEASLPQKSNPTDAGFDFKTIENFTLEPGQRKAFSTGIAWNPLVVPNDSLVYLQIAPRSGLALKNGIQVFAGIVDQDYRGEIKIILYNSSMDDFVVHSGDRIAQGIVKEIPLVKSVEVEELSDTVRGIGGFGHTGV